MQCIGELDDGPAEAVHVGRQLVMLIIHARAWWNKLQTSF